MAQLRIQFNGPRARRQPARLGLELIPALRSFAPTSHPTHGTLQPPAAAIEGRASKPFRRAPCPRTEAGSPCARAGSERAASLSSVRRRYPGRYLRPSGKMLAYHQAHRPFPRSPTLVGARHPPGEARSVPAPALIQSLPLAQLTPFQTSDLVKRRYSTRFNNGPPPSFDSPVPRMPKVAAFEAQAQAQAAGRERDYAKDRERSRSRGADGDRERRPPPSRGGGGAPPIDMKALRDPDLNADQC